MVTVGRAGSRDKGVCDHIQYVTLILPLNLVIISDGKLEEIINQGC